MPSLASAIETRARLLLGGRTDLSTAIQDGINDQLKEISTAYRFPELETTTDKVENPTTGDQAFIDLGDLDQDPFPLYVVSTVTDVTDSSGHRRLEPVDIREIDKLTVQIGIAKRYSRWGDKLYLDASIENNTTRTYKIRHRNYHAKMAFDPSDTLSIPEVWDEVIASGAALRVARDVLKDFDMADELDKRFARAVRARTPVRDEETRDQNFGLQVVT